MSSKEFSGAGGSKKYRRTADTLYSTDTVELLLGISEGPIKGLKDDKKSFYVGETPLEGLDGDLNFPEAELQVYTGLETGEDIVSRLGGFGSSNPVGVNLEENIPVVRSGLHTEIDYLEIRLIVNALYRRDKKGEYTNKGRVRVEIRASDETNWVPAPTLGTQNPPEQSFFRIRDISRNPENLDSSDPTHMWVGDGNEPYIGSPNGWRSVSATYTVSSSSSIPSIRELLQNQGKTRIHFPLGGSARIFNGTTWVPINPQVLVSESDGIIEISGKTTKGVAKEYRIPVPKREGVSYSIRVTQLDGNKGNEGSDSQSVLNVSWDSFEEIAGDTYNFPGLATTQFMARASNQFTSIPEISGVYEGRIVRVPSNYDPETRVYNGVWDGQWKFAYTNNPAFIGYDLVMNTRYGVNSYYPVDLNKWDVYEAGQWADEITADGSPRFTFNGLIEDAQNGREAVNYVFGVLGARFFDDGNGQAVLRLDRNDNPVAVFSNANVVDGQFVYTFAALNEQHNDITVTFTNPELNWARDRRRVFDQAHINRYGRIPRNFEAVGCTSASEAIRRGRYQLVTGLTETMSVSFQTNRQGNIIQPYDIILVADEDTGMGWTGRVTGLPSGFPRQFDTRDPIFLEEGFNYVVHFHIHTPDGTQAFTVPLDPTFVGSPRTRFRVTQPIPAQVTVDTVFSIGQVNTKVAPKPFRVMSITPDADSSDKVSVQAIEVNRLKWDFIDGLIPEVPVDVSGDQSLTAPLPVPRLDVTGTLYQGKVTLVLDWGHSPSRNVAEYEIDYSRNGNPPTIAGTTTSATFTVPDLPTGEYLVGVTPINRAGVSGPTRYVEYQAINLPEGLPTLGTVNLSVRKNVQEDGTFHAQIVGDWEGIEDRDDIVYQVTYGVITGDDVSDLTTREPKFTTPVLSTIGAYQVTVTAYSGAEPITQAWIGHISVTGDDSIPEVPTGWRGFAGLESIFLEGDPSNESDFKEFVIYNAQAEGGPYHRIGSTSGTEYSRRILDLNDPWAWYRVSQLDRSGNESPMAAPIFVEPYPLAVTVTPPGAPTGLEVTSDSSRAYAIWNASPEEEVTHYDVLLRVEGGNPVSYQTSTPRYEWPLQPNTSISVQVRAVVRLGSQSPWSEEVYHTTAKDDVPPEPPQNLSIRTGWGSFILTWDENTEDDLAFYEIWESETNGTPGANATFKSLATMFVAAGYEDNVRRYFAVRAVDTSGNRSDWTETVTGVTTSLSLHTLGIPTELSVSSVLEGEYAKMTVSWSAVDHVDGYDVEVTESGNNPRITRTVAPLFDFYTLPGVSGSIRVRSHGALGEKSQWSAVTPFTAASDTVAPDAVENLTAQGGIRNAFLKWDEVDALDLSHYEVYQSLTTTVSEPPTYRTAATTLMLSDLQAGETYNFWVRAVDTSGNLGPWSSMASVTPISVAESIQDEIINAEWLPDLGFIRTHTGPALPTSYMGDTINWNGKLYTWSNDEYAPSVSVGSVDFSTVTGQLGVDQISNDLVEFIQQQAGVDVSFDTISGFLNANQIPAGLISPDKISTELEDFIREQAGVDVSFSNITGVLNAAQIPAGLITADKIAEDLEDLILEQGVSAAADAQAAANSASQAGTFATEAGTQAGVATSQANLAQTARSQAETFATQAAQSRDSADGWAAAAAESAGISVGAVLESNMPPSRFDEELNFWTSSRAGRPETALAKVNMAYQDGKLLWTTNANGGNILTRGVLPWGNGKAYRIEAKFRVLQTLHTDERAAIELQWVGLSDDFASTSITSTTGNFFEAGSQLHTLTAVFSDVMQDGVDVRPTPTNRPWVRFGLRNHRSDQNLIVEVEQILITDVTAELNARASATSSSQAAASATEAGQEAAAATSARTAAETARGQAVTARNQAVAAKEDAEGAVTVATEQAGLAATARDQAGQSATAASQSATAAASSATSAGQQASAATSARTAAETARGQAVTARNEAVTARDNAQGSATSAATSAGLAVTARQDAETAAAAASDSASEASASASEAGQEASAANSARTAAETARGQAVTARNEAVTARNTAQGSATTATQQAGLATTARDQAGQSANAASQSASAAASSANEAGQEAAAATSARTAAETARGQAVAAEGVAVAAKNDAETAVTEARSYSQLASLAMSGGMLKNPTFMGWTGPTPPNVMLPNRTSPNGTATQAPGKYGNAILFDVTSNSALGAYAEISHSLGHLTGNVNPQRLLVTLEVEVLEGTPTGTGVQVGWFRADTGTWAWVGISIGSKLTVGAGIQTYQVIIERPAVVTDATDLRPRFFPSYSVGGGSFGACKIKLHRFDVQEVVADSFVDEQRRTKATVDGIAESGYLLRVKAGGAAAGFEMVAADNPSGPASSIRMSADEIIMDGTLRAPHFAAGSITVDKFAAGDFTNLVINGSFEDGTLAGWTNRNVPSRITVQERNVNHSNSAVRNMPTRYALDFSTDGSMLQVRAVENVPLDPDDQLHLFFRYAGSGTDINNTIQARISWFDASGATVGGVQTRSVNVTTTAWRSTNFAPLIPPANAAYLGILNFRQLAGGTGGSTYITNVILRRKMGGVLIQDGSITADHVIKTEEVITNTAQIKNAIITDGHISGTLHANKIRAGTQLANNITVDGTALGTVRANAATGAQNPATRINNGSTNINPGRITVSGSTTLAAWRGTSDTTKINGGQLETDSVETRALRVKSHTGAVNIDPFFQDPDVWAAANVSINAVPAGHTTNPGPNVLRANTNINRMFPGTRTPINARKSYTLTTWLRRAATNINGRLFLIVRFYNAAGTGLFTASGWPGGHQASGNHYFPAASYVPASTDYNEESITLGPNGQASIPAGAAYIEFGAYFNYQGTTLGQQDIGGIVLREMTSSINIEDGAITGAHLIKTQNIITEKAQIKEATIEEAHISGTLNASIIRAGTQLANTITVNGTALSTVRNNAAIGAQDPASRINAANTRIDPGKITISGTTTLNDWRGTRDATTINGGRLETNSVRASSGLFGDISNLIPNGDILETDSPISTYWLMNGGTMRWVPNTTAGSGAGFIEITRSAGAETSIHTQPDFAFPASEGEEFSVEIRQWVNALSANGSYGRVHWLDVNKSAFAYSDAWSNSNSGAGWHTKSGQVKAPAGTKWGRFRVYQNSNNTSTTVWRIDSARIRRLTDDVHIADGAVKARHVEANSVNANHVNTNSFAASGLALFGGTMQSTNFNAGAGTGWRLTNAGQLIVPDGSIGNAKIGNIIQSNNFSSGAGGSGWRINKNGNAEFNTVTIRRQIEVASGEMNVGNFSVSTVSTGSGSDTNTNPTWATPSHKVFLRSSSIPITAWLGVTDTYLAVAGMDGRVFSSSGSVIPDVYWGWEGQVLPLTRWTGNQTLRVVFTFWSRHVSSVQNCVLFWKIYKVS